jgi:two-component system sensor histidine kinase QseC
MNSIRGQLTALLLTGLGVLALGCGTALYLYLRIAFVSQFDQNLLAKATLFTEMSEQDPEADELQERPVQLESLPDAVRRGIASATTGSTILEVEATTRNGAPAFDVEIEAKGVKSKVLVTEGGEVIDANGEFAFQFSQVSLPEYQPSLFAEYFQVRDEDGETVAKSPSLGDGDLPPMRSKPGEARCHNIALPDGRPGRAAARAFSPRVQDDAHRGEGLTLVMARSREELDRTLASILTGLLAAAAALAIGGAWLVRWGVAHGLRPIGAIANEASSITANSLALRFTTEGATQELQPIAARLNELLTRLDAAFAREKRFTADVAHELRTPIAELRALAEVALREAPGQDTVAYFEDARELALQMEGLVTALLTLARADAGNLAPCPTRIDLVALVHEIWGHCAGEAAARSLQVKIDLPSSMPLDADRDLITILLRNLLGNAAAHTPADGNVTITLAVAPDKATLSIGNTNDGLKPADLDVMRQAFWRKDAARTGSNHSGLGLALADTIARLLHMRLIVALPTNDHFQVDLEIPIIRDRLALV